MDSKERLKEGSPPPTRGTHLCSPFMLEVFGITPAYAGNTCYRGLFRLCNRDHPRLRGEHYGDNGAYWCQQGSPPPTRGTLRYKGGGASKRGITPAYAGNTCLLYLFLQPYQDHPRLRGEHCNSVVSVSSVTGSPPPTRGTRCLKSFKLFISGITPAYAGNTPLCFALRLLVRDHPRLRGEHSRLA